MPPDTAVPAPGPLDFGPTAREYLEHHGYADLAPCIRSRDLSTARRDPFLYYLTRRLGLGSILRAPSSALARGSWIHKRLEYVHRPDDAAEALYREALATRLKSLREVCNAVGWQSENLHRILDTETLDAECALGWLMALAKLRLPSVPNGLFAWLRAPSMQILGTEVVAKFTDPRYPKTPLAVTFDLLYYLPKSKTVWVLDYKSTDSSCLTRAATVPCSFQTLHYRYVLTRLIEDGFFERHYNLPPDIRVGGMSHVLLQKPTIVYGNLDRPYVYRSFGKKPQKNQDETRYFGSGESKPQSNGRWSLFLESRDGKDDPPSPYAELRDLTEHDAADQLSTWCGKEAAKEFTGEPSPILYAKRCLQWYLGEGDYADDRAARESDPPINISTIRGPLDEEEEHRYHQHLDYLYHYATCQPIPQNFPRTDDGMTSYGGKLTDLAPFYVKPVAEWPAIILDRHLVQSNPDADEGDPNL